MEEFFEVDEIVNHLVTKIIEKRKTVPQECMKLERERIAYQLNMDNFTIQFDVKSQDNEYIIAYKKLKKCLKLLESQPESGIRNTLSTIQSDMMNIFNYLNVRKGIYSNSTSIS